MKVREHNLVTREGTFTPMKTIKMDLASSAEVRRAIIKNLTELYANPDAASRREYPSNAWDSHQKAGNLAPIEIELPTLLRPMFVVRDFGVGMTLTEIEENYALYGSSTKQDSDAYVGMLGYGCKAALAYATYFTLVAIKDGIKVIALIARGEDGVGDIQVMDTGSFTDEPNGVTVEIPVPKDTISEFNRKAYQEFRFWDPGTIKIDGEICESIWDTEGIVPMDPDILIVENLQTDYVVMGNVAYPCNIGASHLISGCHIVARVEIGEVDFPPSRETIQMTPRTTEAVREIRQFVDSRIRKHVQDEIDKAPTHWDALLLAQQWASKVDIQRLTYQSERIPTGNLKIAGYRWYVPDRRQNPYGKAKETQHIYMPDRELRQSTTLFLFDHPGKSMDRDTKDALVDLGDVSVVYVMLGYPPALKKWLSGVRSMTYKELRPPALRLPGIKAARKPVEKWLLHDGYGFHEAEIPDARPVCYFLKTDNTNADRWHAWTRDVFRQRLASYMNELRIPFSLVMVATTHQERFLKLHPEAKNIPEFLQDRLDEVDAELTEDALDWGVRHHPLGDLDADDILDPKVKKIIRRITTCSDPEVQALLARRHTLLNSSSDFLYPHQARPTSTRTADQGNIDKLIAEWTQEYPLAEHHLSPRSLEYMNAIYYWRKKKK